MLGQLSALRVTPTQFLEVESPLKILSVCAKRPTHLLGMVDVSGL